MKEFFLIASCVKIPPLDKVAVRVVAPNPMSSFLSPKPAERLILTEEFLWFSFVTDRERIVFIGFFFDTQICVGTLQV